MTPEEKAILLAIERIKTERDQAVNELTLCRTLLDSYGFHQVGIHNGIQAMWNQIHSLKSK
jgi:hypothetical protein